MDNLTCAAWYDLYRLNNFNYILFQFVDLIAGLITLIFTFLAIRRMLRHSILQDSTKVLLVLNIFYAVVFQCTYGIEATLIIHKSFFKMDKPCELLQLETDCAPYLKTIITCTSGMIYCQTGLILERTFATFLKHYHGKKSLFIGLFITFLVIFCSVITGPIIYWDDQLPGALLTCFQYPKDSMHRSIVFLIVATGITVFNLATAVLLNKYNTRLEYKVRFKICARFHKREVIQSTRTICFLTSSQFLLMFIYSTGTSILKSKRSEVTAQQYMYLITWLHTVPFIAMLFPILLTYRISKTNSNRAKVLVSITSSTVQTQEEHITQIKTMWK